MIGPGVLSGRSANEGICVSTVPACQVLGKRYNNLPPGSLVDRDGGTFTLGGLALLRV